MDTTLALRPAVLEANTSPNEFSVVPFMKLNNGVGSFVPMFICWSACVVPVPLSLNSASSHEYCEVDEASAPRALILPVDVAVPAVVVATPRYETVLLNRAPEVVCLA